ncbi:acyl-CoA dehydrogenase family protein [Actinocorallia sp. A-T 12471]|uniref:acyl-CoA dehydrogenase family protein n=1 Tax=Actinocorallia sp. A-T 12471 TaxID=3089813 RepID=UPI0029CC43AA|nr:acyl-CoA dehydrogenase family protein [Actinocorallia sp. A-T 12471]MDX6740971.1 acyl-CoA dehydrogenase family protein [Actinocorallia sp. A-T 12471]
MDATDTPELAAFRAEARAWLAQHAPAHAGKVRHRLHFEHADTAEEYEKAELASVEAAKAWQAALHAGGWAGISWPAAFGGRGGTPAQEAVFAEESDLADVSTGPLLIGLKMVGPTLMRHGTASQCAAHLGPLLRGERVWCQLYSEPEAGSDLAALRTRAVLDEAAGEWVVTGQKVWTSSARVADWAILLARTNTDVPKHQGITYFLVDMRSPGIEVRPLRQMNGSYHFNEVFLDAVRVPAAQVVGEVDGGWKVVHTTLAAERAMIGGGGGEKARALLALAQAHGRADDPLVRQRVAEVFTLDEILRFLGLKMRAAIARGVPPGPEGSIMKLLVARRAHEAALAALEIEGESALLAGADAPDGGAWQQQLLSAQGLRIGGGTDFIQLNAIAERILGLPRRRQPDRDVPFRELTARRRRGGDRP